MDDGDHELIENTECDEALLGIVEAIVFVGIGGTLKDSLGVGKIEAVLFDIQLALRITPREPRNIIVYTIRLCVKMPWQRPNVLANRRAAPAVTRTNSYTGPSG